MCGINKHSYFEIVMGRSECRHETSYSEHTYPHPSSRRSF